jgi:hypothetical protein
MSTIPPATTLFRPGLRLLQTKGRGRCGRTDRARSNRTVSAPLVVCLRGSVNRRVAYVSRHDGKAVESL